MTTTTTMQATSFLLADTSATIGRPLVAGLGQFLPDSVEDVCNILALALVA